MPGEGLLRSDRVGVDGFPLTYRVDANVLSEVTRAKPEPRMVARLQANERDLVVDPIIVGEIRFGIHLLPRGRRRERLERWFGEGIARIHCVPWDFETGLRWAQLLADLRVAGLALPIKDSMIAATALKHGFTVVTRNGRDFDKAGVGIFDPFG